MSVPTNRIGFIGLGVMGEPICARLWAHAGKPVVAYDLDAGAIERIGRRGVATAATMRDLVERSDVVFLSLPSGEIVSQVARASGGLLECCRPGQVVVDLSTSAVESTRALAGEFARRRVAFLDAPVARTRAAAEAGTLLVMVGGVEEVFRQIEPLLATFASDISFCGAVGSGQVLKILNNMILFEIGVAIAEAKAIGVRAGVDPRLLFETLTKGSADSFALRNHGVKAILPDEYPERAFSVRYARKDLRYALDLAEQTHVRADAARHVDVLFDKAIAEGLGEHYWPVISKLVEAGSVEAAAHSIAAHSVEHKRMPRTNHPAAVPEGRDSGVAAIDRAMLILSALEAAREPLSLAELASALKLYKSTILRILASLRKCNLVVRRPDQRYALGHFAFRLGRAFEATQHLEETINPVFEWLIEQGAESPSFHVRYDENFRLVLFRSDSHHSTLDRVRTGDLLPMARGAAGKVLTAFENGVESAANHPLVIPSFGERDASCAALAAPVFGSLGALVGALSVSGPLARFSEPSVKRMTKLVMTAAERATTHLGGRWPVVVPAPRRPVRQGVGA